MTAKASLNVIIVTRCNGVTELRLFKNATVNQALEELEELSEEYNPRQYVTRIFASTAEIHELPLEIFFAK